MTFSGCLLKTKATQLVVAAARVLFNMVTKKLSCAYITTSVIAVAIFGLTRIPSNFVF